MRKLKDGEPRYFIYALIDPRTGVIRYIGQSTRGMFRPLEHARPSNLAKEGKFKTDWIKELKSAGFMYEVLILKRFDSLDGLDEAEKRYIKEFRAAGIPITNMTNGGSGGPTGLIWTKEALAKLSASAKKAIRPPVTKEAIAKTAAFNRGKHRTAETKSRIGRGNKGKVHSKEVNVRVSRTKGGKPFIDQNGDVYDTLYEAARKLDLWPGSVYAVLIGKSHQTEGYSFSYLTEAPCSTPPP